MNSDLPLEVLGYIAPFLCWVEMVDDSAIGGASRDLREQDWLAAQLPTASTDRLADVLANSRSESTDPDARRSSAFTPPLKLWKSSAPGLEMQSGGDVANVLSRLAERYFVWSSEKIHIRKGRMEELHELSLRFPVSHVIRHAHAEAVVAGFVPVDQAVDLVEQVSLLPSNSYSLRTVIKRGLSEGHLHLNGITNASDVWCQRILSPAGFSSGRATQSDARILYLGRCAAQVLALAALVARIGAQDVSVPMSLLGDLDALYFARTPLEEWSARSCLSKSLAAARDRIIEYLKDACLDRDQEIDCWQLARWIDPGRAWFAGRMHYELPYLREGIRKKISLAGELHFYAHWQLLTRKNERHRIVRHFLHEALFRYMVIQTHHWQRATQTGRTTGLGNFRRYYSSLHRKPRLGQTEYHEMVLDRLCQWHGLRVLEGRISPPRSVASEVLPWVTACSREVRRGRLKKFGLVIHFIKDDFKKQEKLLLDSSLPWIRYSMVRRRVFRQALRLYRLLTESNEYAPFIVGIDAANIELAVPPEVFAPAFRFLRELPIKRRSPCSVYTDVYGIESSAAQLTEGRRLGMTYHVGEDFRHLLSGLRSIYEVIEFLKPHPGDRLGHAIALALPPKVWFKQNGYQAVLPKIEWLDTLVWIHHLLGPGHDLVGVLGIEDRIQRLSWELYKSARKEGEQETDWSPLTLYDAWRLRQLDPFSLELGKGGLRDGKLRCLPAMPGEQHDRWMYIQNRVIGEVQKSVGSKSAYEVLASYWLDPELRKAGSKVMVVDMQDQKSRWVALCEDVEERMMEEVQNRQLVVEVNPTVNRFIGPMQRLDEHHIFKMTLDRENQLHRRIRVTVNTDNPAVFNTSLSHQYYLLGESLMDRGEPEGEVVEWLEWLRRNGEDYSFVRQLPEMTGDRRSAAMRRVVDALEERYGLRSNASDLPSMKLKRFWERRYQKTHR